jgi:hypothetical protein
VVTVGALANLLRTNIRSVKDSPSGMWIDGSDRSTCDAVRSMSGGWSSPSGPWREVLLADPGAYCGSMGPITMDHIDPVRSGAKVSVNYKDRPPWFNAAPACRPCNAAKSALTLLAFVAAGGLGPERGRIRKKPPSLVTKGSYGRGARVAGLMPDGTLVFVWHPRRWFPQRPV